ncbi:MAG: GUN4 domain-containing protein, partial [Waterburya sp.]
IEELKIKLTHSNQSINSLAQQLNLIDNSTLTSDVETIKDRMKQLDRILEDLNNAKAKKEVILEIDTKVRQIQESQQEELQKLTSPILQNQQHIEELKIKLTHSNQSINSLTQQLNLIDNSTLNFDIESLKTKIKQLDKVLEYLNNTKAEKEAILEIERQTKQLQEFQQKIFQLLTSISNHTPSSKKDRFFTPTEKLASFLKAKHWKEANEETAQILLTLVGKQSHEHLNQEDLKQISPEQLNILDQLWSTYSNERFSWSVQKQIWQKLGGQARVYDLQIYEKWSQKVGWRVDNQWLSYSEIDFTDEAPIGHFPAICIKWSSWGAAWCGMETLMLFSKLDRIQSGEYNQTENFKRKLQEFGINTEQEINSLGEKFKKVFNPLEGLF